MIAVNSLDCVWEPEFLCVRCVNVCVLGWVFPCWRLARCSAPWLWSLTGCPRLCHRWLDSMEPSSPLMAHMSGSSVYVSVYVFWVIFSKTKTISCWWSEVHLSHYLKCVGVSLQAQMFFKFFLWFFSEHSHAPISCFVHINTHSLRYNCIISLMWYSLHLIGENALFELQQNTQKHLEWESNLGINTFSRHAADVWWAQIGAENKPQRKIILAENRAEHVANNRNK